MQEFEKIKELAEGFFSLTGRPISTMTVEEYIKFHKMADMESICVSQSVKSSEDTKSTFSAIESKNESCINNEAVREEISAKEEIMSSNVIKPTPLPQMKEKTEIKAVSKNNALEILRSVAG